MIDNVNFINGLRLEFDELRRTLTTDDGEGPFTRHGEKVFDDYWRNYLTKDMALAIDSEPPYANLDEYWRWRNRAG